MNQFKLTILRGRTFFDMLYTWLDFRELNVSTHASLSYKERIFYYKLRPCLQGENLVIYDVGAASGNVTNMLAKLNNVSVVYAFEPIPEVFSKLQKRVGKLSYVQCFNVALGDVNKSNVTLYQSEASDSSSLLPMGELHRKEYPYTANTFERTVQEVRLDDWVEQKQLLTPDLVKLDVQGFEAKALTGGEKTIRQAHYCVLEMAIKPLYDGAPLFQELYDWMRNWGFDFEGFISSSSGKSGQILQVDGLFVKRL